MQGLEEDCEMAKRFTDTEKWKKLRDLSSEYKLLYNYICDACDHAGIWIVDFEIAQIYTGQRYNVKKATDALKDRVHVFDDGKKWYIKGFIEFQYITLKRNNRPHLSAINLLEKYGLDKIKGLIKDFPSPLQAPCIGVSDGDKDKDKDQDSSNSQDNSIDEYSLRKKHLSDYTAIIKHLNDKTGKQYSPQASLNLYLDLIKHGYTINDFFVVINNKVSAWSMVPEMSNMLRPRTLFKNKVVFDDYLNTVPINNNNPMNSSIDDSMLGDIS
jgi:uncharacterized phage protein (TIGR02220 family)